MRAINEGWDVPAVLRRSAGTILGEILVRDTASDRDRIRAIRTLLGMDKANLEMLVRASELGLVEAGGEIRVIRTPIPGPPDTPKKE